MGGAKVVWKGELRFEGSTNSGFTLPLDTSLASGGGTGFSPMELLLVGLAGCTAMDVISILKKMHEPVTWFNLKVSGDIAEEHPKKFTGFRVVYQFKKSDGLNPQNVQKAVELSQNKYCGVSATLKDGHEVAWDIEYI